MSNEHIKTEGATNSQLKRLESLGRTFTIIQAYMSQSDYLVVDYKTKSKDFPYHRKLIG